MSKSVKPRLVVIADAVLDYLFEWLMVFGVVWLVYKFFTHQ